jgi:ferredoxin, 2Fe-2S
MPKITVISPDNTRHEIEAPVGRALLSVLRDNGFDLEGTCEGSLACATCHVIIDPAWFPKLKPIATGEHAMLDFAEGLTPTSRLSCQIPVSDDLDGMVVRVPEEL